MLKKSQLMLAALLLFFFNPAFATLLPENIAKSRTLASAGMVLLKNHHHALPLKKSERVAVFGNRSFFANSMFVGMQKSGGGSGDVYGSPVVDVYQGLQNQSDAGRIVLDNTLINDYRQYLARSPLVAAELDLSQPQIAKVRQQSDTAIVTIGRQSMETIDHTATEGDYYLSQQERDLLQKLAAAEFKKLIVVLNIGTQMDLTWLADYGIDAAIIAWYGGAQMGNALADILLGDINPSGKLPHTYATSYQAFPSAKSYHQSADFVNYEEDIFVGYRYFETFNQNHAVQFPFGFGLSYSQFDIEAPQVDVADGQILITVGVTNIGKRAGKEVLQVYFQAPQGQLGKAKMALGTFAKTKNLVPNERQVLKMTLNIKDMHSFDDIGSVAKSAYILEAGDYAIYVGNSVQDAKNRGAAFIYHQAKTIVTQQLESQVAPNLLPQRLTASGEYQPLASAPPAANSIKIEAENYRAKHPALRVEHFANATGSGKALAHFTALLDTWVQYELEVPKSGNYALTLRVANGYREIKNMFGFELDGKALPNIMFDMPQTGDGWFKNQWHHYINSQSLPIYLQSGKHLLTIKSHNRTAANIDYFTLTPTAHAPIKAAAAPKKLDKTYLLKDVAAGLVSMDDFINQLSDWQLANLLGGQLGTLAGNTGGIGGNADFGMPSAQTADGPAGIRLSTGGTAFPVAVLLAASWDVDLIGDFAKSAAREALANQVDIWLTPGMNIQRDPLNGRNFEYFSEDPLLTAKMAAAIVTGAQDEGLLVTVKHFIGNEKEGNRNSSDSRISERALREIYLKPFEYVIKTAKPAALMTAYNYVNGYETASNIELLTHILRDEWGYQGLVMTDWINQTQPSAELFAGNDVKMPFGNPLEIMASLNQHISRAHLLQSGKRVAQMLLKTAQFKKTLAAKAQN